MGQGQGPRQTLIELDVDHVILDVQIDEMIGRERWLADHDQELEIGLDLCDADAGLFRELLERYPAPMGDVGHDEQQPAEVIGDAHADTPGRTDPGTCFWCVA